MSDQPAYILFWNWLDFLFRSFYPLLQLPFCNYSQVSWLRIFRSPYLNKTWQNHSSIPFPSLTGIPTRLKSIWTHSCAPVSREEMWVFCPRPVLSPGFWIIALYFFLVLFLTSLNFFFFLTCNHVYNLSWWGTFFDPVSFFLKLPYFPLILSGKLKIS